MTTLKADDTALISLIGVISRVVYSSYGTRNQFGIIGLCPHFRKKGTLSEVLCQRQKDNLDIINQVLKGGLLQRVVLVQPDSKRPCQNT